MSIIHDLTGVSAIDTIFIILATYDTIKKLLTKPSINLLKSRENLADNF
jgi:hypothetical protein